MVEWYVVREVANETWRERTVLRTAKLPNVYLRPVSVSPACGPGTSKLFSNELYRCRFFTTSTRQWRDTPMGDEKIVRFAESLTMTVDIVRDKWLARTKEVLPSWEITFFYSYGRIYWMLFRNCIFMGVSRIFFRRKRENEQFCYYINSNFVT